MTRSYKGFEITKNVAGKYNITKDGKLVSGSHRSIASAKEHINFHAE